MAYGHPRNDRRSVRLHQAIAQKLLEQPDLVLTKARHNLAGMMHRAQSTPYTQKWRALLDLPLPVLADRLTEESDEMTALRQCTPFAGVLSPQERWIIYRTFREEEDHDTK